MLNPGTTGKVTGVTIGGFLQLFMVFTFLVLSQISLVFAPSGGVEIIRNGSVPMEIERDAAIAAEAVKTFFMDRYNVQLRRNIRIILTPDAASYTQAQIKEHGISGEEAIRRSRTSAASSQGTIILLNAAHPGLKSSPNLIATVAHEMVHQHQAQLTNGKTVALEWLTEGMAGILAVHLTESRGGKSLAAYKNYCLQEINAAPALPDLTELRTSKQWRASLEKYGTSVTYRIAEAAAIELHASSGWDPFIAYFQLVNQTTDQEMFFAQSFGISLRNFEHHLAEKLKTGK